MVLTADLAGSRVRLTQIGCADGRRHQGAAELTVELLVGECQSLPHLNLRDLVSCGATYETPRSSQNAHIPEKAW
ncbi:Uncharacterised protein [Mycobacteroides abscessus subsp. abscessus]|nr:Uncharacterised protein [Mycobacteroides abscessus subsp. abscessus]